MDIFTKPLTQNNFVRFRKLLSVPSFIHTAFVRECGITDIYLSRDNGFFTNGYHLVYGVTSMFVYNVTDMLSEEDKFCARITNLSSIDVEMILGTFIVYVLN